MVQANTATPDMTMARDRFYFRLALAMAVTVIVGFAFQLAMGRSTFAARPLVHVHAFIFMGWVALFTVQVWLATHGAYSRHRVLGRVAMFWVVAMLAAGTALTVDVVQRGTTPFFFQPQHFLFANPATMLAFLSLFTAAIIMRRRTDWHLRLQLSAMAALLGPAFGRLLPMPLIIPYAFDAAVVAGMAFPLVAAWRDRRQTGRAHPAWWWGMGITLVMIGAAHLVARSPLGDAVYSAVTAGTPGATLPGMAFPPSPPMP